MSRKSLSLKDRITVIELKENGMHQTEIAKMFNVGRTQIDNICKKKQEIINKFKVNENGLIRKSAIKEVNGKIDELTFQFYKDCRKRNKPVTGHLLQKRALQFAKDLQNNEFKASNGWLHSFIKRNNILLGSKYKLVQNKFVGTDPPPLNNLQDSSHENDQLNIDCWNERLPELCKGYKMKDIYNLDETTLFYSLAQRKYNSDSSQWYSKSHKRITVCCLTNMIGDREKLAIISKFYEPAAPFRNIKTEDLPVHHYFHKNVKLTSATFQDYLNKLDEKLKSEARTILIFLDRAKPHLNCEFQNIKLIYFPVEWPSAAQPLEKGIFQLLKLNFRNKQMQFLRNKPSYDSEDIYKSFNLLDMLCWVALSWNEVSNNAITIGFVIAGFPFENTIEEITEDTMHLDTFKYHSLFEDTFGATLEEVMKWESKVLVHDEGVEVIDWNQPADQLLQILDTKEADNGEEMEEEEFNSLVSIDRNQALCYLNELLNYSEVTEHSSLQISLIKAQSLLLNEH